MIIVEGPDGAGKTTLIEKLSNALELPIAPKVVDSHTNATTDLVKWVDYNIEKGLTRTLYDRHRLISEPIYGPVVRGHLEPGFDNYHWLHTRQQQFRDMKPLLIWCLPPIEEVLKNLKEDPLNKVIVEHGHVIYWLYWNEAAKWKSASLLWDYTIDSYYGLQLSVEDWMRRKHLYA